MTNQAELLSVLATRGVVDARPLGVLPTIGERRLPSLSVGDRGGTPSAGEHGGTRSGLAALLATRKDIDATLHDQRPPYEPPDLLDCYASDLKYQGATRRLCGRSAPILGRIRRGGGFADCWVRGLSRRCSNHWATISM